MIKNLKDLIETLKKNKKVIGIVEYGSRNFQESEVNGDYDIFVIVEERLYSIESLHFYVNDIPVDLNVRIVEDLKREEPLTFIDVSLYEGRIIYDRNKKVCKLLKDRKQRWYPEKEGLSEHDIAFERFSKKHVLDKVKGRLDTEPILCNLLLTTNIYWLTQSYFKFNDKAYPGEKEAIRYIRENEPDMYKLLREFYQNNDLKKKVSITREITNLVLKNVGGPWKEDEIIAFGINEEVKNIKEKGKKVYESLLKIK